MSDLELMHDLVDKISDVHSGTAEEAVKIVTAIMQRLYELPGGTMIGGKVLIYATEEFQRSEAANTLATLRDFYASSALTGILSKELQQNGCNNDHIKHANVRDVTNVKSNSSLAFNYADEMIRLRGKNQ